MPEGQRPSTGPNCKGLAVIGHSPRGSVCVRAHQLAPPARSAHGAGPHVGVLQQAGESRRDLRCRPVPVQAGLDSFRSVRLPPCFPDVWPRRPTSSSWVADLRAERRPRELRSGYPAPTASSWPSWPSWPSCPSGLSCLSSLPSPSPRCVGRSDNARARRPTLSVRVIRPSLARGTALPRGGVAALPRSSWSTPTL